MALRRLTGFSSLGGSGFLVLDGSGGGGVDGGLGAKGILIRATMASRRRDGDEVPWRLRSSGRRSPAGAHMRAAAQGQNGARPLGKKGCDGEGGSGRDKGDAGLGHGGAGLAHVANATAHDTSCVRVMGSSGQGRCQEAGTAAR